MKTTNSIAALTLGLLLANTVHAATYTRTFEILPSQVKTMNLKVQFSGACKGSAVFTDRISVMFDQRFETDNDGMVKPETMKLAFSITNGSINPGSWSGEKFLLTTGGYDQTRNTVTPQPLHDASEKITEKVAKEKATVTYSNKNPDVLIRQFNYQQGMLERYGRITQMGNIDLSKCIKEFQDSDNNLNIKNVQEVEYFRNYNNNSHYFYDKYIVDSSKKTNIVGKFRFGQNPNAAPLHYTLLEFADVKATMTGSFSHAGSVCSGKLNGSIKTTCKRLKPLKYKVSFVAKGDIL